MHDGGGGDVVKCTLHRGEIWTRYDFVHIMFNIPEEFWFWMKITFFSFINRAGSISLIFPTFKIYRNR